MEDGDSIDAMLEQLGGSFWATLYQKLNLNRNVTKFPRIGFLITKYTTHIDVS
jgi:hypothetical protein